jgi:hypothetical protein
MGAEEKACCGMLTLDGVEEATLDVGVKLRLDELLNADD